MTARLREVMRAAAQDVPTYAVHDRARAAARRTRRRTLAATAAVAVIGVLLVLWSPIDRAPGPDRTAEQPAALPDRIGVPPPGTLRVTDRPRLEQAAVLFSGGYSAGTCPFVDECDALTLVDAHTDRYRLFLTSIPEAPAGQEVVLAADGRRVAHSGGYIDDPYVRIIELRTGQTRDVPSAIEGSGGSFPVSWSRDGRWIAVRDVISADQDGVPESILSIVDLDSGQWRRLASGPTMDGFSVAFAPDGRRFAYQIAGTVTVAALDGSTAGTSFSVSDDQALGGKGAWTPDGRSLTIVERQGADWTLRYVDPVTGAATGGPATPAVTGRTGIRLLAWREDGSALIAAFEPSPESTTRFDKSLSLDERTYYGEVHRVDLLALTPGGAAPTTVLSSEDGVLAIDVADDIAVTGRMRDGNPPKGFGPRFWFWTGLPMVILASVYLFRRRWEILFGPSRWQFELVRRIR
ncbi:hypothetical protein FHR83_009133 [Actinoplanes campanulatus]|uniref:WD40-like Beta Propeller Repeat n=1 Tax=Actinoplanes campanulatus TaxID=113559 RepID=A0A7W5AT81_9ACTN|nr:hypothetical protein [Actinoplanes campanulatus]MBB3101404.1 hypothetical protein [Actinoplanes campanulatus]GGN49541.1 hypothetical protein GCM10010109_87750 [Actinoplanes campanulatus]GID42238.1 hypothetical protein Aca09nite_87440 [Actinoplanes campanulatus]